MKKYWLTGAFFFLLVTGIVAQGPFIRPASLGISFIYNDYTTPARIRAASVRQVLRNKEWADLNEMSPGFSLTYFQGLHNKIDFAGSISGSFVDNAKPNHQPSSNQLLLQAEATLQAKMFSDKYMFTPFLIAGIGASKFNEYYGAYMPLGGGFKVNFFDEAAFFINAKYHLPVTTETLSPGFVYGLGIAGIIGKKKEPL